jgi:hypothetical protein
MVSRLLAITVPLSLVAAAHASSAAVPAHTSPSRAPSGSAARPVAGTGEATPPWRASPVRAAGFAARAGAASGASGVAAPGPRGLTPTSASSQTDAFPLFGASGDAISIDPLGTCIGCTGAGAASRDSSSYSQSIKVADESLAEGESPANGYAGGSVVTLPPNSLLGVAIGTWWADNRHDATSAEGHSYASGGQLTVDDGKTATLTVFDARSDATRGATGRHGSASSDALHGSLASGEATVILLHSDASTDGPGHVSVAQVNQDPLMTSDEMQGGLPLTAPRVVTVNLLRGGSDRATVGELTDSKSNGAAEIMSSSVGDTSGPRNQTH